MIAALEGMIAELRQIGVPVSLAERIDAMQSLRHLPVGDRATVKAALRAVLVKTHDHELAFDAVFDLYFTPQPAQAASAQENSQAAPDQDGQGGQGGLSGQNGHGGGGGLGALESGALTELLLTALRDGNEVMMRALASLFVDRHAGIEPGRPVAGTYYVFRTLRAVDPDRLLARLAEGGEQAPGQAAPPAPSRPPARCSGDWSSRATRPSCSSSARWSRRRSASAWWTTVAPRPWPAPCAARCRRTWTS